MKKLLFQISLVLFALTTQAQILTTNPQFPTHNSGVVELIYDAASPQGNMGLLNHTGDVYAHIGVITNTSTGNTDWKYVVTPWPNSANLATANIAKNKLTSLGNNKYKLTLSPNIRDYFAVPTNQEIQKIAIVLRNADGTKTGKTTAGSDIFVDIASGEFQIAFTNPNAHIALAQNTALDIKVGASQAATIELFINNQTVKTTNNTTELVHNYTFAQAIDYELIAKATANNKSIYDTIFVCVPAPVQQQARPQGAKLGINYNSNSSATLVLHAPLKQNVFLIGEFNDWRQLNAYQMKKDGDYFWITIDNLVPAKKYSYQYLVDGNLRVSDPYTNLVLDPWNDKWINFHHNIYPDLKAYPEGKTEGLVAVLQTAAPQYQWEMPNFVAPTHENMVIYELLLRDFTNEKSLDAAIGKLDYLKNLGITAVQLMPIQQFDGNNSWGYNPNHFFAPDKAYGSPEMYKKFIDECHKRGMAVILDIVPNHATGSSPLTKMWWNSTTNQTAANNPYFNVTATHPYSVFHDFNHEYSYTRQHFRRMIQYWLTEYKVDGYRLDLTKGLSQRITNESNASRYDQSRIDILTDYHNAAKEAKPDVMFILEHFCDYDEELALANKGMYLWRNQNNAYSQAAMGFQSQSSFEGMITNPRRWVSFAESHDEERNFYKAKTWGSGNIATDSLARIRRVPLNIAFTMLLPGPKMIWQFGEMGFDYSIGYYLDNGVPKVDAERGRTSEKPAAWQMYALPHRKAAVEASSKIMTMRRLYPEAFTQGTFSTQVGGNDWTSGRRIALTHSTLNMVALGNFQVSNPAFANANFPKTGTWYNLLTGETLQVTNTNMQIAVMPGMVQIFTDRKVEFTSNVNNTSTTKTSVFPSVTNQYVYITSSEILKSARVSDLNGRIVLQQNLFDNRINFSHMSRGMYILEIITESGIETHKVIRN